MKLKLQKLILCIIVTTTIFNLLISLFETSINQTYATGETKVIEEIEEEDDDDSLISVGDVVSLPGWVLVKFVSIPALIIGTGFQSIILGIAKLGGSKVEGFITPDDIFFNRVGITSINFFDFSIESSMVKTIRTNIASWYYILRIFATVILLAVLIYIGIRMAISTVASEKAQYKKMLKDWVVSFALLFLLNYIIIFTLEANNALIQMLSGPAKVKIGNGVMSALALKMVIGRFSTAGAATIVYVFIIFMTINFFFTYIKRMLTLGFLIIISPLITITYSIDRINDGKAQALNTWMKEFMYNVLIQPFHCIIYLTFVSTVLNTLDTKASFAKLAIVCIFWKFIYKAEDIVKQIFGFKGASSIAESTFAAAAGVRSMANIITKGGGKALGNTKFGKSVSNLPPVKSFRNLSQRNDFAGATARAASAVVRETMSVGAGVLAASAEAGANTSKDSFQVGIESYRVAKSLLSGGADQQGTYKKIQADQNDLKKFADYISNNNNFNFQNYGTNTTSKNNLRAYANSLIGANMDYLNNNIQDALRTLSRLPSGDYDPTTANGVRNLKALQDMALSENLDFTDPTTSPLGTGWTADEINAVTAIQVRNLAQAVNSLHTNYQASGSTTPDVDVDNFINGLT